MTRVTLLTLALLLAACGSDDDAFYALAEWDSREGARAFFEQWQIDAEPPLSTAEQRRLSIRFFGLTANTPRAEAVKLIIRDRPDKGTYDEP